MQTDVGGHLGNHRLSSVAEELFSHLSQPCLHLFMQETDLWILVNLVPCQWIPSGSRQLLSHLKLFFIFQILADSCSVLAAGRISEASWLWVVLV